MDPVRPDSADATVATVLMIGLVIVTASVPVTIVLWDPTVPSCDWGHAETTGLHLETCEQRPDTMECVGLAYKTTYTVQEDGSVALHSPVVRCRGAWVHSDNDQHVAVEPEYAPVPCDRQPGMLYGLLWINDGFRLGCGWPCPTNHIYFGGDELSFAPLQPCVLQRIGPIV